MIFYSFPYDYDIICERKRIHASILQSQKGEKHDNISTHAVIYPNTSCFALLIFFLGGDRTDLCKRSEDPCQNGRRKQSCQSASKNIGKPE